MTPLSLAAGDLTAVISPRGAELTSLQKHGRERIWQGDTQWWPYQEPVLFPIVGRLRNGQIDHEGKTLHLPAHGFARDMTFKVRQATSSSCELVLRATDETRSLYPFEFELQVCFRLDSQGLTQHVRIMNRGAAPMPASFGFHPGFVWQVDEAQRQRQRHSVTMSDVEEGPVFRIDPGSKMVPCSDALEWQEGRRLPLTDALFRDGAIVLNPVRSTALVYANADGPLLTLSWKGCRQFGMWSLPGAPFVCFEPWYGHPLPADFYGLLTDKPGGFILAPGQSQVLELAVVPT